MSDFDKLGLVLKLWKSPTEWIVSLFAWICQVGLIFHFFHFSECRFDEYCAIFPVCKPTDLLESEWKMPQEDYFTIKNVCTKTSEECKDAIGGVADQTVAADVYLRLI